MAVPIRIWSASAACASLFKDHRLAGDESVPFRMIPGDDLSGIDPDPDLEANGECAGELLVQRAEAGEHVLGGSSGPEGVVLVCDGHPEHGHHLVPDELLDRAAVPLDDLSHPLEEAGLNPPIRPPGPLRRAPSSGRGRRRES